MAYAGGPGAYAGRLLLRQGAYRFDVWTSRVEWKAWWSPAGAGSSGNGGGDGDAQSGLPPRDPARGKDPAIVEETPREVLVDSAEFIPPVETSRRDPISKSDLAEFVGEDALARLMERTRQWL